MPPLKKIEYERFCLHYAKTANGAESYREAGYKPRTNESAAANARRLLMRPEIQQRLQEIADEMSAEKIADIREIQEYLTAVMRREHCEYTVVVLSKETSKYAPDENGTMRKQTVKEEYPKIVPIPAKLSDANKAAETLAKMQGGFDTKLQVELTVPVFGGEDDLED